jgi:SAM-dependent methyltransferase
MTEPELVTSTQRPHQMWAAGDVSLAMPATVLVAEALCEAVDIRPGQRVLDVATGSGDAALAAARRWAAVRGIDAIPALLERARERARAERLHVGFQLGDTEAIPFPDAAFDVVLSGCGAMFVSDHRQTAQEMVRVCRPGGTIGLATWTPDGFIGAIVRATATYVAPPPCPDPPTLWGSEERLHGLFGDAVRWCQVRTRSVALPYRSLEHVITLFRTSFGPTRAAFAALDAPSQQALARTLTAVAQQFNRSGDAALLVPGDYLELVAVKT